MMRSRRKRTNIMKNMGAPMVRRWRRRSMGRALQAKTFNSPGLGQGSAAHL